MDNPQINAASKKTAKIRGVKNMATANYKDLKLSQNNKESRNTSYKRKTMTRISQQVVEKQPSR